MDRARSAVRVLSDCREGAAIGRHARLDLVFAPRRGRTIVAHGYAEPPFRIGRASDQHGAASLIVVAAAPGVFGGDRFLQTIRVASGARVLLTSQAALQVHPDGQKRAAELRAEYDIEPGGELHGHWDPTIPFAAAAFDQRITIRLAADSFLYWSDAMMSGRCGRGEAWRFDSLAHELRVVIDGALAYLERYRLDGGADGPTRRWIIDRADYVGTTLVHHPAIDDATAALVQRTLAAAAGVTVGVDRVAPSLLVVRMIGRHGPAFAAARRALREVALAAIFRSPHLAFRCGL